MKKQIFKLDFSINHSNGDFFVKSNAFTLIELLIAMMIFLIFLTVASSAYVNIVRAQSTANEVRKMYSEIRDFADFLLEEVRGGTLFYACPESICLNLEPEKERDFLVIKSNNRFEAIKIFKDSSGVKAKRYQSDLFGIWTELDNEYGFLNNLEAEKLNFDFYPKFAPKSTDGFNSLLMPHVRLNLTVKSKNPEINFNFDYQTLISFRTY